MRRRLTIGMLVAAMAIGLPIQAQVGVGKWRDCLDYSTVYHIAVAGEQVYAAGTGGVFCYDRETGITTTMSKATGLHDVGISDIGYDRETQSLVIAYTNSNIDIIQEGHIYNLSDIKRSDIAGDKQIYHLRFHDGQAFLAAGFGIAVVDLTRHEIKETYYIGNEGGHTAVYDIAFGADSIYAATAEGLKRTSVVEPHPSISSRWETDTRLDNYTIVQMAILGRRLLLRAYQVDPSYNTLLVNDGQDYTTWATGEIRSLRTSEGKAIVSKSEGVWLYDSDLHFADSITSHAWGELQAFDAELSHDGALWVGHAWDGMVGLSQGNTTIVHPSGPESADNVYRLVPTSNSMMLCPGGHTTTYANTYLNAKLLNAKGRNWENISDERGILSGRYDVVDAAINPIDPTETAIALWGSGIAIAHNGKVENLYDEANTDGALNPYVIQNYSTLLTGALVYDNNGNLWVLNSHQPYALACRDRRGNWSHLSTEALASVPEVDKLVWDSITGYLWFCGRSNTIYVHDGKSRMAKINPNNGSRLTTESINALAQDQSGNIWIGTNKGIKVIYDSYRAFNNGGKGEISPITCNNITITNGEFAEYLMAYENITSIAVDGANRKWVGTANGGLYLLSANGLEQLEHFTVSNSPLLSDKIIALGIQPQTGEVFIGTDHGVQVYRSTATYADNFPQSNIYAFPNPIRPDYDGPIAIKGFTRNAMVRITDAAGHTVYSTSANGGQAIWHGRTNNGDRVASGVYYVFATDPEGENRSVAKILIIR